MKQALLLIIVLSSIVSGCNQDNPDEPDIEFEKTYIKAGNQEANRLIVGPEGIIMIGTSVVGSNSFLHLDLVDFDGSPHLTRTLGENTAGASLKHTIDNGLICVGSVTDATGNMDVYLVKTDTDGTFHWSKSFGGPLVDQGLDVIELENGDFMIIGTTQSFGAGPASMYVIKTDSQGNEIWSRTFGGDGLDGGSELLQINSFEIMLLGFTESFGAGNRDIYLQSVSTDGDSLWSSSYGGSGYEESQAITRTVDGGYIMSNHSASNEPNHSILASKLDANGQLIWEQEFGTSPAHEGGEGVLADSEGNHVFLGRSDSFGNDEQVYFIKTDSDGNVLDELNFGAEGDQRGTDMIEHEGSYYICGQSTENGDSNILLIKRPM